MYGPMLYCQLKWVKRSFEVFFGKYPFWVTFVRNVYSKILPYLDLII